MTTPCHAEEHAWTYGLVTSPLADPSAAECLDPPPPEHWRQCRACGRREWQADDGQWMER